MATELKQLIGEWLEKTEGNLTGLRRLLYDMADQIETNEAEIRRVETRIDDKG